MTNDWDDDVEQEVEAKQYSQDEIKAMIVEDAKPIKAQFKALHTDIHIQVQCEPINREYGYSAYYHGLMEAEGFYKLYLKGYQANKCVQSMTGSNQPYGICKVYKASMNGMLVLNCGKAYALVGDIELYGKFNVVVKQQEEIAKNIQSSQEVQ